MRILKKIYRTLIITILLPTSLTLAESWKCGDAVIQCSGSVQTCNQLKKSCYTGQVAENEIEIELSRALKEAKSGGTYAKNKDPFKHLSNSLGIDKCSEEQISSGTCPLNVDSKGLVEAIVDTLRFSADAFRQAGEALK